MEEEEETHTPLFERLIEAANRYKDTGLALARLKAIDRSSTWTASLASAVIVAVLILSVVLMLDVALALWLGGLAGSTAAGFLIVAVCNALLVWLVYANRRRWIEAPVKDAVVTALQQSEKQNHHENGTGQ